MRTLVSISLVCLLAVARCATVAHYSFPPHYGRYAQASATVISHPWDNINPYYNILQSTPSQEVCGVLNGVFKTFHCMDDLLAQVLNGHAFTLYCNGPCPQTTRNCAAIYNPICATNSVTTKTFTSPCAMGEENYKTGSSWVQISIGICPEATSCPETTTTTPAPCSTTTASPPPPAPCSSTTTSATTTTTTTTTPATSPETTTETTTETTIETTQETLPDTTTEPTTEPTTETTAEASAEITLNPISRLFMLGAANEIETTPAAPEATTDCPAEQDSECESEPECVAPQETFASFMKALGHISLKDLPSASRISFRNNVKNKYNVYAEGDVYNKPCNKNCNRKCSNKKC